MGEPWYLHSGGGGALSTSPPRSGDSARDAEYRLGPGGRAGLLPGPAGGGGGGRRGCGRRGFLFLTTPPVCGAGRLLRRCPRHGHISCPPPLPFFGGGRGGGCVGSP